MSSLKSIGSRAQVMHENAKKTSGGLTKSQLKYNKQGKIVSKKASALAKKNNRLVKAGYVTRKGVFGGGKMMGGSDLDYKFSEANPYMNGTCISDYNIEITNYCVPNMFGYDAWIAWRGVARINESIITIDETPYPFTTIHSNQKKNTIRVYNNAKIVLKLKSNPKYISKMISRCKTIRKTEQDERNRIRAERTTQKEKNFKNELKLLAPRLKKN